MNKVKDFGQVFTPIEIVDKILDFSGYDNENIIDKIFIENSCGIGNFIVRAIERYIKIALDLNIDKKQIIKSLENNFVGIDIDNEAISVCLKRLEELRGVYFPNDTINWQVYNDNSLSKEVRNKYKNTADFVIGNPPYIRTKNISIDLSDYEFCEDGNTDLYLAFFELGFEMLKKDGILCYITPNSWLYAKSAQKMRDYIFYNDNMTGLIDFGHNSPFEETTYCVISKFKKSESFGSFSNGNFIDLYEYNYNVYKHIDSLKLKDMLVNGKFIISYKKAIQEYANISNFKSSNFQTDIQVKQGFQTSADKLYIKDFEEETPVLIDVIKSSTGEWHKCIYPYDQNGNLLSLNQIKQYSSYVYDYLMEHKAELEKRDIPDKNLWWSFGRNQCISDVNKRKVAISSIIKDISSIKINEVSAGKGVYGGMYILTDIDIKILKDIILSKDFLNYVRLLKKYKNGGWYSFNGEDLEKYLVYKLEN